MATQTIKRKRTRVTQKDIERARQELAQAKVAPPTRPKAEKEKQNWGKDSWHGLVYCDSYGHAWISGQQLEPVYLGKADEFIPYLKGKGIDGGNVDSVLIAAKEFRAEKESQSCHSDIKSNKDSINTGVEKPHRATFKRDTRFLRLLDGLISKGYGTPTIQSKLKEKGYDIAYRTLGRWVRERKTET